MKIMIEIPKEFEADVNQRGILGASNGFVEFFGRVKSAIACHQMPTCGLYEKEIAEMFAKAFDNLQIVEVKEDDK